MTRTVNATFDGDVLRTDEPIDLEPNTRVRVTIETVEKLAAALDLSMAELMPDWAASQITKANCE